jgi:predicted regulator of Ras-like GTPase activity (Roadblock/LC7/MglB family)
VGDVSRSKPKSSHPKYEFGTSSFLVAFLSYPWVSHLVREWGYVPYGGTGIAIVFGMGLGILLTVQLIDYVLARVGLEKPIRSGIWLAAALGPTSGFTVLNEWGHPVGSHVVGSLSTVLAFGLGYFLDRRKAVSRSGDPQLERILAQIASESPKTKWIAVVTTKGIPAGHYLGESELNEDRVSAMSAAMESLGGRVAQELENGNLQYALVAGTDGITMVIVLGREYLLALGLRRDVSVSTTLDRLRPSLPPLLDTLQIEEVSWLK